MKVAHTSAAALAFVSSAIAATSQPKPFSLILETDSRYNGYSLGTCHEGANIESLCIGPKPSKRVAVQSFYHNTTAGSTESIKGAGVEGALTYVLRGSNFVEPQTMSLSFSPTSNVALPLFGATDNINDFTSVAFNKDGCMNIQSYIDDTTNPATIAAKAYYRWYICDTLYGYNETTLSWAVGEAKPENPTCVKVEVKRHFV